MIRYLHAAFFLSPAIPGLGRVPVNLLFVAAMFIFGFVHPGFWFLGVGLETAGLLWLASERRFQKWVDASAANASRIHDTQGAEATVKRILRELPPAMVQRFESLRNHCLELRTLAQQLQSPDQVEAPPLDDLQLADLDRLLWIELRLLYTQRMLDLFFERTNEKQLRQDIDRIETQLRELEHRPEHGNKAKIQATLQDTLATSRDRLVNFEKARDQSELVRLEVDRLETKIRSLSELAVNRHEPNFIAAQVDSIARGIVQTERTMNELQFATGLPNVEDVPALLQAKIRA